MGGLDSGRKTDPDRLRAVEECRRVTVRQWLDGDAPEALGPVDLTTDRPHLGGVRSWFACPACGRRCRALHQLAEGDPWRCRTCHRLTYLGRRHAHRDELVWVQEARLIRHLRHTGGDWQGIIDGLDDLNFWQFIALVRIIIHWDRARQREEHEAIRAEMRADGASGTDPEPRPAPRPRAGIVSLPRVDFSHHPGSHPSALIDRGPDDVHRPARGKPMTRDRGGRQGRQPWPATPVPDLTSAPDDDDLSGTPVGAYSDAARIMRRTGLDRIGRSKYGQHVMAFATPEEKAQALERLAFAQAKVCRGAGGSRELVGRHGQGAVGDQVEAGGRLTQALPGDGRNGGRRLVGDTLNLIFNEGIGGMFRRDAATGRRLGWRPWEQAGWMGRTEDKLAPLVAGRKVGTNVEDSVRMANYLGNLRNGMTPDAAGALTKKIHFDYGDLTGFEKNVMRRLVPFYTYMRKNLPFQAGIIGRNPGAIMPQLRAATNVGDQSKAGVRTPAGTRPLFPHIDAP